LDELAGELHRDEDWRQTPLVALLPGIERLEAWFPPPIGVRATNCLLRDRISDWTTLGARTPADLYLLPNAGRITVEEILKMAVRERAHFHLRDPLARADPLGIYEGLLALSAWGMSRRGTDDPVAAVAAAAESPEKLPPEVAGALRALRRIRAPEDESRQSLEEAFIELEGTPGFRLFVRRQLEEVAERPTLAELADELGVSRSRIGQMEASVRRRLERRMQEPTWPIRLAAEQLRERLGAARGQASLTRPSRASIPAPC
jgi:hypothetical protein